MKLTICLVTRGREQYLDQILNSFLPFLNDQNIEVFLIDNGSDLICQEKLAVWQLAHSDSSKLIRFNTNDSRYTTIWPEIIKENIDWIVMPGDDDQLRPEILAEWKQAIQEDRDLVAFASSCAVMNEQGVLTGEIISPTAQLSDSRIERVAKALHEPAFVWPSLFFRASKVDPNVPASRYAFDWWVGVSLLIAGNVKTTKSIGLNYRAHSSQESNLAPNRRKYFEGSLWLDSLVRSERFITWIERLSDKERLLFWKTIIQTKPIYGDDFFAQPIVFSVARVLMDTVELPATAKTIATQLALSTGVFLKDGESNTLVNDFTPADEANPGNLRVNFASGTCDKVLQTGSLLGGGISSMEFQVACHHSTRESGAIIVDCEGMSLENLSSNADLVVNAITKACEARGDFEFALSSGERASILLLRVLRAKLPGKVKSRLRQLKNIKQTRK